MTTITTHSNPERPYQILTTTETDGRTEATITDRRGNKTPVEASAENLRGWSPTFRRTI